MIKKIVILIIIWLVFAFADYFYLPYFVQPFSWLLVCITLLILLIKQIIKVVKERKNLQTNRILNFSITLTLFLLTFYNFNKIPNLIIEKIDWNISYNKRTQIVKDVLSEKLKPNTKMNNGICRLSFDFPIVSNGGNDIWIYGDKSGKTKTVKFWISRGFFESPQIYFIYTNDNIMKENYNNLIKQSRNLIGKLTKIGIE